MKTRPRSRGRLGLNGNKVWCSSRTSPTASSLLARTDENVEAPPGLSCSSSAKAAGHAHHAIPKLGMRALGSCQVALRDVFVPDADVLGELGQGWYT